MKKSEYRELYKAKRQQITVEQSRDLSSKIFENLKKMEIWQKAVFHSFVPIEEKNEINTRPLIDYLLDHHKVVVVPKMRDSELLSCKINRQTEWVVARFGVPEPKSCDLIDSGLIDVVFVPLLVCDQSGNRIGYGGGFYDRFLSKLNNSCLKIGLNFFEPVFRIQGIEDTDIPLDYCVTPDEIVSFGS